MPAWLIPAIGAASNLLGGVLGANAQSAANRQSQQFQWNMYGQQRQDALADWNRQNEYNSPLSQMTRFKDAGLNPNLIYGQGTQASTAVRASSGGSYTAQPTGINPGPAVMAFMSLMMEQAQISNQEKLLELREKELLLKDIDLKSRNIDLDVKDQTRFTNIEMRQQALKNLQQQNRLNENADSRAWISQGLDKNRTEASIAVMNMDIKQKEQAIEQSKKVVEKIAVDMRLTEKQILQVGALIDNLVKTGKIQDFQIQLNDLYLERRVGEKIFDTVINVVGGIIGGKINKPGRR